MRTRTQHQRSRFAPPCAVVLARVAGCAADVQQPIAGRVPYVDMVALALDGDALVLTQRPFVNQASSDD